MKAISEVKTISTASCFRQIAGSQDDSLIEDLLIELIHNNNIVTAF